MSFPPPCRSSRYVWTNTSGRVQSLAAPPQISDGSPSGSYFWDYNTSLLYVKVKGGQSLEMRTENTVQVRLRVLGF